MDNKNYSNQLCWNCKKATGGCAWSSRLLPVDGWSAKPTTTQEGTRSFEIKHCPEYEDDNIEFITQQRLKQRIMQILNVKNYQLEKMRLSTVVCKLKELGFEIYCYYDEETEKYNRTMYGLKKNKPPS